MYIGNFNFHFQFIILHVRYARCIPRMIVILPACSNHDSLCLIRPTRDKWATLLRALFADISNELFYISIRNVNYSLKTQYPSSLFWLSWWDSVTRSNTQRVVRYRFSHLNPDRHPNSRSTTIASERLVHSEKLKEN